MRQAWSARLPAHSLGSTGQPTPPERRFRREAKEGIKRASGVQQSLLTRLTARLWLTVPPRVSETGALLLGPTAKIQFVPSAHFIGTLSGAFDFNSWDTTATDDNGKPLAYSAVKPPISSFGPVGHGRQRR